MAKPSKIFTGFRALGFVSDHVPLCMRYDSRKQDNYVVTSIGRAFHSYNCSKLGIVSVSDCLEDDIECIAVDDKYVFVASGQLIQSYKHGRKVAHRYEGHDCKVLLLLPFAKHLISVDVKSSVKIWDIESGEIHLDLSFNKSTFNISCLMHPNTYLNKILLASSQGSLQLWNIRSGEKIYTFNGWNAGVTALEQAPAVDVTAIGLSNGQVILHNLKYDETVMKFSQDWGPVTCISFRTDDNPIMTTGSILGHIALWNLEERKLHSQILDAHKGSVTGMKCFQSEPLMITSGPDNSLKIWIFDQPDGSGRLLKERSGNSEPPTKIKHHGMKGEDILAAGLDSSLRSYSTIHESHNKNMGRASFNKKESRKAGRKYDTHVMPPIMTFDSEITRQSDWDGIAACHSGLSTVTTWNFNRSTMGSHKLVHERFSHKEFINSSAHCMKITKCGNFVVVGYTSGHIDKFNMQSGLHRGTYGNPKAHRGCVRHVEVDALNQMIVSGGADHVIRFWKFKSSNNFHEIILDSQISKMCLHHESSLMAVSLDDFMVIIIDVDTKKIVRRFFGHRSSVTDMVFSPDSRWLVTSAMDSTVRVWDLPSGCLVDSFLVYTPITSMSFSPTADFLATIHNDDIGIYLWSNMTLYKNVEMNPLPEDYQPLEISFPSTSLETQGIIEDDEESSMEKLVPSFKSPDQISCEMITLCRLSQSKWKNLLNLDVIKERNKPKQPPKVPKGAPFFLPTVSNLESFTFSVEENNENQQMNSRIIPVNFQSMSKFCKLIWETHESHKYDSVINELKEMGPSTINSELITLAPDGGGSIDLMSQFLIVINNSLKTCTNFEVLNAYLALFMKLHGETISSSDVLVKEIKLIEVTQETLWNHLQSQLDKNLCLINYLKNAFI